MIRIGLRRALRSYQDYTPHAVAQVGGPLLSAVGMLGSGLSHSVPELLLWRLVAGAGNAAYLGGAQPGC